MSFLTRQIPISYVMQPIIATRNNELSFFEILGRLHKKNGQILAVSPDVAAKYTNKLCLHQGQDKLIDGLKYLNSFAKSIGKETIIEYIENIKLYDAIKHIEVDYLQGYYLGRPQSLVMHTITIKEKYEK
ncbi:Predicted signal transduction protein containing sensor and EAL domains [Campylobacter hyointestinalis subsp. hyointestinalis]|uniref:Predicted signal transduction protein containing sensor and EAL domains n=1 Tax=Campylobacter hyointestinalis subsp. hyointestinalis TaxID=91352 RepID=A0A0S4SUC2_CAMHY|nr:EAL domain-containing protein [Campylobacter hyointestinalis]CUU90082.1 Predicted signal transduction protein containing sensor and EAL domains [Campylobacter hyointestinalis subsp. hyointestinalis]